MRNFDLETGVPQGAPTGPISLTNKKSNIRTVIGVSSLMKLRK
jgi:hypothetical protein